MARKNKSKLWEWQNRWKEGGTCEKCLELSPKITVDHIIPITILDVLDKTGNAKYEWEKNFQYLCHPCNTLKANRLDLTNPKTLPLLQELIDKLK